MSFWVYQIKWLPWESDEQIYNEYGWVCKWVVGSGIPNITGSISTDSVEYHQVLPGQHNLFQIKLVSDIKKFSLLLLYSVVDFQQILRFVIIVSYLFE